MDRVLSQRIQAREQSGNLRVLQSSENCIDFASNDYLGFSKSSQLMEAIQNSWNEQPSPCYGATGSRLLTGHSSFIEELEAMISAFHGAESGLIFNSGFSANLGLISSLAGPEDLFFYDVHIHASCREGMRLSKASSIPWRHNDIDHLEKRLQSVPRKKNAFILVESVYSCDGSIAPLTDICAVSQKYHAHVIVDEAHAIGVFGENGRGLACNVDGFEQIIARLYTFSKALGGYGAAVVGSKVLKKYLIQFCRSLIYTTALPWPVLLGIKHAYRMLPCVHSDRLTLRQLITHFRKKLHQLPLPFIPSETPIQSLLISGNARAKTCAAHLKHSGFDIRALLSPTVQRGKERLRICLHAFNTCQEIDRLFEKLKTLLRN